ncbi:MAG: hypothetical protein P4M02_02015 [Clostridia bacterium]|nr:hypothetical protein [Clostridia bacterium]
MVEIRLAEQEKVKAACEALGEEYTEGLLLYDATESGEDAGFCLIRRSGVEAQAVIKTNGRLYIYDGLLRAALSLMLRLKVRTALLAGEINAPLAEQLGFRPEGGRWSAAVKEEMFPACCGKQAVPNKHPDSTPG